MSYEDGILYLLPRKDMMSLNHTGKMAAQCAHAANMAADMNAKAKFGAENRAAWMAWEKSTDQGFGTTIVLGACLTDPLTIQIIQDSVKSAIAMGYSAGVVHDPTFPLQDGPTTHLIPIDTCGWIFGSKAGLEPLLKYLRLHPPEAFMY